jgi:hypothetical protein
MLKVLLLVVGTVVGAAGATSWLLSEPEGSSGLALPVGNEALQQRWNDLQSRLQEAANDGKRAGEQTEERLRRELDLYRAGEKPATE